MTKRERDEAIGCGLMLVALIGGFLVIVYAFVRVIALAWRG